MNNKPVKIFVASLLIIISYGFIIYKLISFNELKQLNFSDVIHPEKSWLLVIVFALMILNWSTETLKWKILVHKIHMPFKKALRAVFGGITIGIFTPNRIGEIGGRTMFLTKGNRTYGILATSLGSYAQFITTILNGLMGFALFLIFFPEKTAINPVFNRTSAILVFFILLLLLFIYFNVKIVNPILLRFSFFKSRASQLDFFSETNINVLFKVIVLSTFRYLIFITQFYLLLSFFDIKLTLLQGYISISLMYLFTTLIPTTTLVELGIRGSLSIFFIGMFSDNILDIVLSSILLWIINLAIPVIIGSLFLSNKYLINE